VAFGQSEGKVIRQSGTFGGKLIRPTEKITSEAA
jgi:hypothetical protein